ADPMVACASVRECPPRLSSTYAPSVGVLLAWLIERPEIRSLFVSPMPNEHLLSGIVRVAIFFVLALVAIPTAAQPASQRPSGCTSHALRVKLKLQGATGSLL